MARSPYEPLRVEFKMDSIRVDLSIHPRFVSNGHLSVGEVVFSEQFFVDDPLIPEFVKDLNELLKKYTSPPGSKPAVNPFKDLANGEPETD